MATARTTDADGASTTDAAVGGERELAAGGASGRAAARARAAGEKFDRSWSTRSKPRRAGELEEGELHRIVGGSPGDARTRSWGRGSRRSSSWTEAAEQFLGGGDGAGLGRRLSLATRGQRAEEEDGDRGLFVLVLRKKSILLP